MDYHLLAREILDLVGGPDNIASFTNCMTRLRLNLIRPQTADAAVSYTHLTLPTTPYV